MALEIKISKELSNYLESRDKIYSHLKDQNIKIAKYIIDDLINKQDESSTKRE